MKKIHGLLNLGLKTKIDKVHEIAVWFFDKWIKFWKIHFQIICGKEFCDEMRKDWESFHDLHDQHSWRPFVHCIALHAVILIFIIFIYVCLLYIINFFDYTLFSVGFSLYVGSFGKLFEVICLLVFWLRRNFRIRINCDVCLVSNSKLNHGHQHIAWPIDPEFEVHRTKWWHWDFHFVVRLLNYTIDLIWVGAISACSIQPLSNTEVQA